MNKLYKSLAISLILLASSTSFAQYDAGDTTVINTIKTTNFGVGTTLNWSDSDPGNWMGVVWDTTVTPYRIIELELASSGSNGGNTNNGQNTTFGPINYSYSSQTHTVTGATTDLTGTLDVSGLSELKKLFLNRNPNLTGLNVSGLTKLEYLYSARCNFSILDVSGITSLIQVKSGKNSNMKSADFSGCSGLKHVKLAWDFDSLESVNYAGCTSLEHLTQKNAPLISSLDVSATTSLLKISVTSGNGRGGGGLTSLPTGLSANTNLRAIGLAQQSFSGTIDLSPFDSLFRFSVRRNYFTKIIGTEGLTLLNRHKGDNNNLTITDAAQLHNDTNASGTVDYDPQGLSYGQNTVLLPDSLDMSAEDSIDINGTMTSTTFTLYNEAGVMQSSNSTGVFTFDTATTGCYYVVLVNSGVTVTTDTICVVATAAFANVTLDNVDFGSVELGSTSTRTLTVSNSGNATLNVSNITLPTGYTSSATTGTVAGGGSTDFTVTFAPTMAQTYAGMIDVASDASASGGSNSVLITGTGIVVDNTGISDEENALVSFYPNPTTDVLYVKDNTNKFSTFAIYDVNGTLVKEFKLQNSVAQIDARDLTTGIYFVRSVDGKINRKIVKY